MSAPRWTVGLWAGHPNYQCATPGCMFATLAEGEIIRHVRKYHPRKSEQVPQPHPLDGVPFATDRAAELAVELGLEGDDFEGLDPHGRTGGYNVADVKTAARIRSTEKGE